MSFVWLKNMQTNTHITALSTPNAQPYQMWNPHQNQSGEGRL